MSCYKDNHRCQGCKKINLIVTLIRIFISSLLTGLSYIKFQNGTIDYISLTLTIIAYAVIGYDTIILMVKGWIKKEFFNENFLMVIATVGAFVIGKYQASCIVLIFYHIGELIKDYVLNKANKSITKLIDSMPKIVHRYKNKDEIEDVDVDLIRVGDILQIKPSERVSIDGVLLSSCADLDQSSLIGESLPITKNSGEKIYSGSINLNTTILIKTTKEYQNSTANSIIKMILDEKNEKARQEKFIRSFSKIYTPIVCFFSLVIFIVLFGINGFIDYQIPLYNALNILIIACPSSLVISIPLVVFMGISKARKLGVLIKGGAALEKAARLSVYCFNKTESNSLNGLENESAINSSNIVIMNNDISKIDTTKRIAKKVLLLIYENIVFIFTFKLAIIILSAFSISNMIFSIAADVGVMTLAVLNSLRIFLFKEK